MANNYLQFSEMITKLTPDETKWWADKIKAEDELRERSNSGEATEDEEEYICSGELHIDFENDGKNVWLHGDEFGSVDRLAAVVQAFLIACRPKSCFSATWAEYCSKPRIGEFGGGGVFVTATDIQYFNPSADINNAEVEFKNLVGE